jgi:hypothetical protein
MYGGQQVGYANIDGADHASLWSGTADSWVDLHAFAPSEFTSSVAEGIWNDGATTFVSGYGWNETNGRNEALMWVSPRA